MRFDILTFGPRAINHIAYYAGFRELVQDEAREIRKYFEQVTPAFTNHSVVIEQKGLNERGGNMDIVVGVLDARDGNKIFSYVNWGTSPRRIDARWTDPPLLRFRPLYKRATTPGSLSISPPWTKSGDEVVLQSVWNTGIAARRFDKVIQVLAQADMNFKARRMMAKLAKKTFI